MGLLPQVNWASVIICHITVCMLSDERDGVQNCEVGFRRHVVGDPLHVVGDPLRNYIIILKSPQNLTLRVLTVAH